MTMSTGRTRRDFLADVGRGAIVAALGSATAGDLGLAFGRDLDDERADRLTFGPREALVGLMQETSLDRLVPVLVESMRGGTSLRDLVAAAALANARTFGGED